MATNRGRVRVEPGAKRIRIFVSGVAIADTIHPLYVWENPSYPAYYIPVADVRMDLLDPTATVTHSPSRGDAATFTVRVDGDERIDAAWQYRESPIEELRDHVRFDWGAMDAWFEEDEEVFTHARSPYTRIDILPTSRLVRVEAGGVVLAESPARARAARDRPRAALVSPAGRRAHGPPRPDGSCESLPVQGPSARLVGVRR